MKPATLDIIEIDNLRLRCFIGFSPHELKDKQDVIISLRIGTDLRQAGNTDKVEDTFNYRTPTKAIIELVESSRYKLVEKLANEIAVICVVNFDVQWVKVRVHKPAALRFSDSVGVVIERTPNDFTISTVYVSLGSNIEPQTNLKQALTILGKHCRINKVSSAYTTPPQGFKEQSDFWNAAVQITTHLTPEQLKCILLKIESVLLRVRDPNNKNAARTIDLDISLWNDQEFEFGEKPWKVPEPDILKFAHVVVPLAEITPDYLHPVTKQTLSQLAAQHQTEQLGFTKQLDWSV